MLVVHVTALQPKRLKIMDTRTTTILIKIMKVVITLLIKIIIIKINQTQTTLTGKPKKTNSRATRQKNQTSKHLQDSWLKSTLMD